MLGVNLGGVVNGVVTFVPRIKAHGEGGHVVNTARMAAFIAGPGAGIYTTAKFAVHGLSDALRWSLLPYGIGVSMVCPGLVKSKIYESDLIRPAELSTDVTPADAEFMRILPGLHEAGMDPEESARRSCARSAERLLRLHAPRAPRRAAGDLRRDARRVPRRAGAAGPARGRGGPPGRKGGGARLLAGRLRRMEEVEGKTAFVTGGASGIGLGMAKVFVEAGMNVVIADVRRGPHRDGARRDSPAKARECTRSSSTSPTATASRARPTRPSASSARSMSSATTRAWAPRPVTQATYDDWDWGLGVMLGGAVNGIQTFLPRMLAHGEGGHIVNTSSMAGVLPIAGPRSTSRRRPR